MAILAFTINPNNIDIVLEDGRVVSQPWTQELEDQLKKEGHDFDPTPYLPVETNDVKFLDDGKVMVGSQELCPSLYDLLVQAKKAGNKFDHLEAFLKRLSKNPSRRAREKAHEFVNRYLAGITKDGMCLGYRGVTNDFRDRYTGKFDNSPGQELSMNREMVDDDPQHTCSVGFHIGSLEYARNWAGGDGRVVLCMFDPADIVSVPIDGEKLRVCRYKVLFEVKDKKETNENYWEYDENEDEDEDEFQDEF